MSVVGGTESACTGTADGRVGPGIVRQRSGTPCDGAVAAAGAAAARPPRAAGARRLTRAHTSAGRDAEGIF